MSNVAKCEKLHQSSHVNIFGQRFRFSLYYFSDHELRKDVKVETMLTIDTRNTVRNGTAELDAEFDEEQPIPPLEKAIMSKYVYLHPHCL